MKQGIVMTISGSFQEAGDFIFVPCLHLSTTVQHRRLLKLLIEHVTMLLAMGFNGSRLFVSRTSL